ncbi:MAG: DUF4097 family beta strand repeat protein [Ruminococcus sp.]|nr:DUF4097 family beta strand repeat protein [Ruminococcus sp.]
MTDIQKGIKYLAIGFAIFLIVMIFSGILGGLSILSYVFDNNENTQTTELSSYSVKGDISVLDVEIAAADFEIKHGDSLSVSSNHEYLKIEEHGNTLEIKETKRPFTNYNKEFSVVLYLPDDAEFSKVAVETGAGRVRVEGLKADELDFILGAGEVDLNDISVDKDCDIEGGAGTLSIKDSKFNDLDLDIGVGECNIESILEGETDINCGVGSTAINLVTTDSVDYQIAVEKAIGKCTIDGDEIKNGAVFGTGDNKVNIECGVGDVSVNFVNKI